MVAKPKQRIGDLAHFGGAPTFTEDLYVGRPNTGDRDGFMERIQDMFDRRWFTNRGPYVRELESRIAELVGAKHCIAMCNATIALEILTRALELTGEVIIPSMTFIATAHALQWQQINPVFCDIDPVTHNLDPAQVEAMITPKTTGIIGVHLWGRPCNVEALQQLADRYDLKVIYDAAHAFSCSCNGRMIGNFGEAEVFSFHATKFFHTFEGGAVVTNNDDLATKIRLMKNFGFSGYDNVVYIGMNGKMSEVSAAMGLASLDSLDEIIKVNREHYHQYRKELDKIPGIRLMRYDEREKCNYQFIVLEIDVEQIGMSRDHFMEILHAERVLARRYFYPGCHRMEPYHSYMPHAGLLVPETEQVVDKVLTLPTGSAVSEHDVATVCGLIRFIIDHGEEIESGILESGIA
ncbi:DegT/DnrJ/EryC1/StrS family aminotransferase [Candidatus Neomarinimicrobiota bacterium]